MVKATRVSSTFWVGGSRFRVYADLGASNLGKGPMVSISECYCGSGSILTPPPRTEYGNYHARTPSHVHDVALRQTIKIIKNVQGYMEMSRSRNQFFTVLATGYQVSMNRNLGALSLGVRISGRFPWSCL